MSKGKTINKAFKIVTRGGGARIRTLHQRYRFKQKQTYKCENCLSMSLIRLRSGIWTCKTCKVKCAGGAYEPQSENL